MATVTAAAWAKSKELDCDVAVVGGGTGGFAAALAACRNGMRVILTEETDWIGGQLTAQGVPPDEHPWIELFGCTGVIVTIAMRCELIIGITIRSRNKRGIHRI